jgi:hypothetical protein
MIVQATAIGHSAWHTLNTQHTGRVIGLTARGLFILAQQHIIYVSADRYRSPLTINLDLAFDLLHTAEVGLSISLSATRLILPALQINLSTERVWHCPPPALPACPQAAQLSVLQEIVRSAAPQHDRTNFAPLLPLLVSLPVWSSLSIEQTALLQSVLDLRQAVQACDDQVIIVGLTSFIGQGRGLTPSGDDLAIGLLLMLNRWHTQHDWTSINQAVIEAAYRTTTTISANLLECAAHGQGDERLITLADGIVAGSASVDECLECVLSWGSSSGIDALVGMAIAVCGASC